MTLRADICETSNGVIIEPYYVQECRDWVHNEEINFTFLPIPKIIETIRNGEFWQSLHVSTIFQALDKLGLTNYKL